MVIYKIVQGNGFTLHISISRTLLQANRQNLVDLDLNQVSGLKVCVTDMFGDSMELKASISIKKPNEVLVPVPSNLECGIYGIEIVGTYNGADFRSAERKLFSIVHSNKECHIPVGIIDGEIGGLMYAKYWIELEKEEKPTLSYYGALATKKASEVGVDSLNAYSGVMNGRNFTIHTTSVNNIMWFVSPHPLTFTQSGVPLELEETELGDLYYYNSDELTEGDNVITVSTV